MAGAEPPVERIRDALDDNGLGVVCSTGLSPGLDVSSPDAAIRRAGIDHLVRSLDTAAALGSPVLGGVTYAPWFHFPAEVDLQPYRERSAASLVEVARAADDLGVDLCVEVLNRFESFMFNTAAEALGFLALVDHPSVMVELDTFHMNIEEDDLADAIRSVGRPAGSFPMRRSQPPAAPVRIHRLGRDPVRPGRHRLSGVGRLRDLPESPRSRRGARPMPGGHWSTIPTRRPSAAAEFLKKHLA